MTADLFADRKLKDKPFIFKSLGSGQDTHDTLLWGLVPRLRGTLFLYNNCK